MPLCLMPLVSFDTPLTNPPWVYDWPAIAVIESVIEHPFGIRKSATPLSQPSMTTVGGVGVESWQASAVSRTPSLSSSGSQMSPMPSPS